MQVDKEKLQKALERVAPGLASKEIIEQSTHFAFIGGDVVTFNGEIAVRCAVEGLDLTGAVEAKPLHQILSKLKKNEIDINIEAGELHISCGKAKAGLPIISDVKLPVADEVGKYGKWYDIPEGLIQAMLECRFSASSDMSFATLTCIHVDGENGRVESCDRNRLTRWHFKGELPVASFLVPAASVELLKPYGMAFVSEAPGWIHFMTADESVVFSCRVYDDEYPSLDRAAQVAGDMASIEFPEAVLDILDRASIFATGDKGASPSLTIALKGKRATVSVQGTAGWFKEETNIKYDGEPVSFIINPNFLKDILPKMEKCSMGSGKLLFTGPGWTHIISTTTGDE